MSERTGETTEEIELSQRQLDCKGLALLITGKIGDFNDLRKQNTEWYPDFSRSHLIGISFVGADLSRVNFAGSILAKAILSGTNFSGADLSNTDLSGAIFSGADLREADFAGANLDGAVFFKERIAGAKNLTSEQLRNASVV